MRKKKAYKIIQLEFKTQSEYEKMHKSALNFYGEGRGADCAYMRECIKQNSRRRKKSDREKVRALVESTQHLNDLMLTTDDSYVKDEIAKILEEQVKAWEF